jgi:hypothetical protein
MKPNTFAVLVSLTWALLPATSQAADASVCGKDELLGHVPDPKQVEAHRQFTLPVISYPYGTKLEFSYPGGLALTLKVDELGAVVCYRRESERDEAKPLNAQRRAVVADIHNWRYAPFSKDGQAVTAVVTETIMEQELPRADVRAPDASAAEVHFTLERSGCYGSCPAYRVDVHGDGRAVYTGSHYVDVVGEHRYTVAPEAVARLLDSVRAKGLWSLRASYRAGVTDNPTYKVTMRLGGQTHSIEDYVGSAVGMPASVTEFEKEIDDAAGSKSWINLSRAAMEDLKAEGFDFASPAGGALLARAVGNSDSHDDRAMLELIELGAPLDAPVENQGFGVKGTLLDLALRMRRETLFDPLIENGALRTNGAPDRRKLDQAFQAAITGGGLSLVQKVWNAGEGAHPSLTFVDRGEDEGSPSQQSPVTLLLSRSYDDTGSWQGREIAQWLKGLGCDLGAHGADGSTLLHRAAQAHDLEFVRYLLEQGIDPSTPGRFGLPALGSVVNEDVAMALLEAGTNLAPLEKDGQSYRDYAEANHWARVVAWLDGRRKTP